MSSQKFKDFMKDLKELCEKHKVILAPSEYDTIQVWDEGIGDCDSFEFQDRTDND